MKVIQQAVTLVVDEADGLTEPRAMIVRLNGNPRPVVYKCSPMNADEIGEMIESKGSEINS